MSAQDHDNRLRKASAMLASKLRVCVDGISKLWSVRIRPGKPRQISRGENQRRPSVASMMRWPQALVVATLARNCLKPPRRFRKKLCDSKGQSDVNPRKRESRGKMSLPTPNSCNHTGCPGCHQQQYPGCSLRFKTLRLMQHSRKTWRPGLSLQNGSFFSWFQDVSSFKSKAPNLIPRIQIQTRAQLLSQGVQPWDGLKK